MLVCVFLWVSGRKNKIDMCICLYTLSVCRIPEWMFISPMTYTRSALYCTKQLQVWLQMPVLKLIFPLNVTRWRCGYLLTPLKRKCLFSTSIMLTHCARLFLALCSVICSSVNTGLQDINCFWMKTSYGVENKYKIIVGNT